MRIAGALWSTALLLLAGFATHSRLYAQDTVVRISESEARKAATAKADPVYPPMARQLHIKGRVQLDAFVDAEGGVEKVQPLSGNPLLTAAASTALKKWKFTPFKNKAVITFTFEFTD